MFSEIPQNSVIKPWAYNDKGLFGGASTWWGLYSVIHGRKIALRLKGIFLTATYITENQFESLSLSPSLSLSLSSTVSSHSVKTWSHPFQTLYRAEVIYNLESLQYLYHCPLSHLGCARFHI